MLYHGNVDEFVDWYDTDGNIINASDGGIIYADGKYHWYGMALRPLPVNGGPFGGQMTDVGVVMYESTDLVNWKYEGVILEVSNDPASELYAVINGIGTASGGVSNLPAALLGIHGGMGTIFSPTVVTYILYAIAALFVFTFGPVNAGCAYLVKNLVKGEPVFLWQDFITTIKRNWKQALPMGILDLVVIGMCAFSLMSYYVNYARYYYLFWVMLLIIMLYAFIRFYLYTIMVTFELTFFRIIKNSVIFCLLGFGRNFIMFAAICGMLFLVVWLGTIFLPLFVISLFILIFATSTFMGTYAAYPKIKQYMIDPYYTKAEQEGLDDEE